jgi:hypothetical protein
MPDGELVTATKDDRGACPKARSLGHSSRQRVRGQ